MRKENLSRHYIQTPLIDQVDDWSDARFWDELKKQILETAADTLITRDPLERSIALLDSFICELMRWRRLFLVYDAAHIVPQRGPKVLIWRFQTYIIFQNCLLYFMPERTMKD